jgi:asparaginyl-tRNA synthetase
MKRTKISTLFVEDKEQKDVVIAGWVKTKRDSKKFSFIEINDGSNSNNLQIFVDCSLSNYEDIKKLNIGSSIKVKGDLVKSPAKGQKYEMQAKEIEIFSYADPLEYPLQKKDISFEILRKFAHLRSRTSTFACVFRIRHNLAFAIHKFFQDKGFFYVHTPIITGSDCEGAGEMFKVTTLDLENPEKNDKKQIDYTKDFFGKETFLTVSGQLNGEAFALSLGDIYTFGPTFRAENSNTYRHASEFWMIEPEMSFYEIDELMDLEEEFLKYLISYLFENSKEDLQFLNDNIDNELISRLEDVLNSDFLRVKYSEALDILKKAYKDKVVDFEQAPTDDLEIASEHERYLTEKHFKKPIILYDFPKEFKAFYMFQNEDGTVRGTDVLVPKIGEIIGGSEREWRYDVLMKRIEELSLNEVSYSWYLDLRKYGGVPHSGFGLGFERFLMFVTGMQNIRDVIPFPRTPKNAKF